jgi:hypothetical protein
VVLPVKQVRQAIADAICATDRRADPARRFNARGCVVALVFRLAFFDALRLLAFLPRAMRDAERFAVDFTLFAAIIASMRASKISACGRNKASEVAGQARIAG